MDRNPPRAWAGVRRGRGRDHSHGECWCHHQILGITGSSGMPGPLSSSVDAPSTLGSSAGRGLNTPPGPRRFPVEALVQDLPGNLLLPASRTLVRFGGCSAVRRLRCGPPASAPLRISVNSSVAARIRRRWARTTREIGKQSCGCCQACAATRRDPRPARNPLPAECRKPGRERARGAGRRTGRAVPSDAGPGDRRRRSSGSGPGTCPGASPRR